MYPLSLDFTKLKGENIKVYAWNSSRKMLPFKAWVVSTDNAEKLLKIRIGQKRISVILSTHLEITQIHSLMKLDLYI